MIKVKRWSDPVEADDGLRILVTRYWPRGVSKDRVWTEKLWDEWHSFLGPSVQLHAAAYGKRGYQKISFEEYTPRYLKEMEAPRPASYIRLMSLAERRGDRVTLLCSTACVDESKCHRTLLKQLIEEEAQRSQALCGNGSRMEVAMQREYKEGQSIKFVDEFGKAHDSLVTRWWGGGEHDRHPACNLLIVSKDTQKTDTYGQQIERHTSVVHKSAQPAPANYWCWPDEL